MAYGDVQKLKDDDFRRLTGFKKETFKIAVEILRKADAEKMAMGGRPHKKSVEDRLLLSCQYWREYRTYFHIAAEFGISKSAVQRTILWVENTLAKSGKFNLPGKKALVKNEPEFEIVVIDATESPICRPKKTKNAIILVKRSDTPSKPKLLPTLKQEE